MYFRKIFDGVVVMAVDAYMDGLVVGGSEEDCDELLGPLNNKFPTNTLGECIWYDGSVLKFLQEEYVQSLLTGSVYNPLRTSRLPPVMI